MFSDFLVLLGLKKDWPKFTHDEVEKHCSPATGVWIVAGNNVYDVTPFLAHHPGGPGALLKRGGGADDCTRDLQFHSAKARAEWARYQIGELDPSQPRRVRQQRPQPVQSSPAVGNLHTTIVGTSTPTVSGTPSVDAPQLSASPLRIVEQLKCCCTKSAETRATSQPKVHCAHCTCPDRPTI